MKVIYKNFITICLLSLLVNWTSTAYAGYTQCHPNFPGLCWEIKDENDVIVHDPDVSSNTTHTGILEFPTIPYGKAVQRTLTIYNKSDQTVGQTSCRGSNGSAVVPWTYENLTVNDFSSLDYDLRRWHPFSFSGLNIDQNGKVFDMVYAPIPEYPLGGGPAFYFKSISYYYKGEIAIGIDMDVDVEGTLGKTFDVLVDQSIVPPEIHIKPAFNPADIIENENEYLFIFMEKKQAPTDENQVVILFKGERDTYPDAVTNAGYDFDGDTNEHSHKFFKRNNQNIAFALRDRDSMRNTRFNYWLFFKENTEIVLQCYPLKAGSTATAKADMVFVYADQDGKRLEESHTVIATGGSSGNQNPTAPSLSSPSYTSNVPITASLIWNSTDSDGDVLTYDVYFGNTYPPAIILSQTTNTTYQPTLEAGKTYYWKIVATDRKGGQASSQGTFTTAGGGQTENRAPNPPSNPSPADKAIGISKDVSLTWTGGDPDGNALTYSVYFGKTNPPSLMTSQSSTHYKPSSLEPNTTYYWKIASNDGKITVYSNYNTAWSFTTAAGVSTDQPPTTPNNPTPSNGGSVNSQSSLTLRWDSGDLDGDDVIYYIYFGKKGDSNFKYIGNTKNTTTYTYSYALEQNADYQWEIVCMDEKGNIVVGPLWEFNVGYPPPSKPSAPFPAHEAKGILLNGITLGWNGGDNTSVTYDIYFESDFPMRKIGSQKTNTFSLKSEEPLKPNTPYYWWIISTDDKGNITYGDIWKFTTGPGTSLAVDFGAAGIYLYDGSWKSLAGNAEKMTMWINKLVLSSPINNSNGISLYDPSQQKWEEINSSTIAQTVGTGYKIENILGWESKLVVDFGNFGLYLYDGSSWTWIAGNPEGITAWGSRLIADFGSNGVYIYDKLAWTWIAGNPESMTAWGNKLVADFGAHGIYSYSGSIWTWIAGNAESMVAWGDTLAVDFGSYGMYLYDGSIWTWIAGNPEGIAAWGNKIAAYFSGYGLYLYDGNPYLQSSWVLIDDKKPEGMIAVEIK